MALITPYIEHKPGRLTTQPVSGGIDTSKYDHCRQGVSMRPDAHMLSRLLPRVASEARGHYIAHQVFGFAAVYSDGDPYDDMKRDLITSGVIDHMLNKIPVRVSVAFLNAGDDDGNIESYNGVIEPLDIRPFVLSPAPPTRKSHTTYGYVNGGNIDHLNRTECICQHIDDDDAPVTDPFRDLSRSSFLMSSASFASMSPSLTGSTVFQAEPPRDQIESRKAIVPFDDVYGVNQTMSREQAESSTHVTLSQVMTILSSSTESYYLRRNKSAAAGHDYHDTIHGTDSIAFGGMLRYKA